MAGLGVKLPLVVIVGPTASGKTSLAIKLAQEFNGEIICADSRTIYKGANIGTAKPTKREQSLVKHWGIDLVNPGQRFTASDFKQYALEKIADIRSRNKVPLLVGGTGLYINSAVYDYEFPDTKGDSHHRQQLENLSVDELIARCENNNINLPLNFKNKRHLINAIMRNGNIGKRRTDPLEDTFIVGITTPKNQLLGRIAERTEIIMGQWSILEAEKLAHVYGWDSEALTGNAYPIIRKYLAGEITLSDAKALCRTQDWRLARRQITWFKRDEHIRWLSLDDAYTYCAQLLADMNKS